MTRQAALLLFALCLSALPAQAEKADRDKPINIEADRISVDDAKKIHTFEGNVQFLQGTLAIRSDRIIVTQDNDGMQTGVATGGAGGLARFRQRREGREDYVEGEAERIVHNSRSEKTEFFQRAHLKSGLDEVRGQYVAFDSKTETYLVTSGPGGATATPQAGKDTRVRAVIQPKKRDGDEQPAGNTPPASTTDPAQLKAVPKFTNPRQE